MIPENFVIAWQEKAPWQNYSQTEQDLVISRAIVEIFSSNLLKEKFLFRGGTALYKLYMTKSARYSEDIDLVMIEKGRIGQAFNEIRKRLTPFLNETSRAQGKTKAVMTYSYQSEFPPPPEKLLKIEINYEENFCILGKEQKKIEVENPWFRGETLVPTYKLNELMATKLRALFQRNKGRDLFDLWKTLSDKLIEPQKVLKCFKYYTQKLNTPITRARFEKNLSNKFHSKNFKEDIKPLLRKEIEYDINNAFFEVHKLLISKLNGKPYAGGDNIFE